MNRRNFISKGALAASFPLTASMSFQKGKIQKLDHNLDVRFLATKWGNGDTIDVFCARIKKDGYDGLEMWWSDDKDYVDEVIQSAIKHNLEIVWLTSARSNDSAEYLSEFRKNLKSASTSEKLPLCINTHSGRDFFSFEENTKIIECSLEIEAKYGVEIFHETHRGRMCFNAPLTRKYLESNPKMKSTLDISHWCCVHESMLDNQQENIDTVLRRTGHIHARIGHPEGPQVNDPRAPEWESVVSQHFDWWDQAFRYRESSGAKRITILTEFGPPDYLPTLPYTRQPVADQWDVNLAMLEMLKIRYR